MGLTTEHLRLLRELRGLLRWQGMLGITGYPVTEGLRRFLQPARRPPARRSAAVTPAATPQGTAESMQCFRAELASCCNCSLHATRLGLSLGRGVPGARLMFVGDWSRQQGTDFSTDVVLGVQEDAMVARMAAAIQLPPETIYLTNLVKCCPQPGTEPDPSCIVCCQEHLSREIALVRPAVLCLMGGPPTAALLRRQAPLARLRGQRFSFQAGGGAIPVMSTYHPHLLLRQPDFKTVVWGDLQAIQNWLLDLPRH